MRRVTGQTMAYTHTHTLGSARLLAATCWSTAICPAIRDVYPANLRVCSSSGCCTAANKKCLAPLINYRLVNVLFRPVFHRRVRQTILDVVQRSLVDFTPRWFTPCFHSISLCKVSASLLDTRIFTKKKAKMGVFLSVCRKLEV